LKIEHVGYVVAAIKLKVPKKVRLCKSRSKSTQVS